jgi:peptidyl-dipeptidase Dcp
MTNPLLTPSALPYQAPPFDAIADDHFLPAFERGMQEQRAELAAITANEAPASFENTLVALERSGQTLTRVHMVFHALAGANTNPKLQKLQEEMAPRLAAHADAIVLDADLFARIEAVHAARASLGLDPESARLLEHTYRQFLMAGATLSPAEKVVLKQLNEEDALLGARFTNLLLDAAKAGALVIADRAELAGLAPEDIDAAAAAAESRGLAGQWVLTLKNTTQQPALKSLEIRAIRERLFKAAWTRNERGDGHDTRATIARLAEIRALKARLLQQPTFAAWKLQDQMAGTPARVESFLDTLVAPIQRKVQREAADIQALIDEERGGFALEPWDWDFYAEKIRRARYDLDDAQLKPYFEINRVLVDGVFYAAGQLYGLTFVERHDVPVYHPDVRVFEVLDAAGSGLGLFYADLFARDNKNGGAWMDNLVPQSKLVGTRPVIFNVSNFAKPSAGQPALLALDDVMTMFHEFGHALHGLFADQMYPSLSGTAVARDFVELPSQFNEHCAMDPAVFERYARHVHTGEPMPAHLAQRIREAETFNQGYALTEVVAAATLDQRWHTLEPDGQVADPAAFEAAALADAHLALREVPPRYRSSYFLHIWANGYDAGYYAYLWAEMLDEDAFDWFQEHGGFTRANGDRFRAMILSRGNTQDYAEMYRAFRGRDPVIGPMLKRRGL